MGEWNPEILTDLRVTEYWDTDGVLGQWFGDRRDELDLRFLGGHLVWDASLLYGPDASWQALPQPLEHFGYTVIADSDELQERLEEIWNA